MNKVLDKSVEMLAIDISDNKSITTEGYLICENVKISHTYPMMYSGGYFEKPAEELFSTYTISSFEGKPITIDHPNSDVTADNWKDLSVGLIRDVRKEGAYLVANLILMDKDAIERVQSNELKEVSIGFSCVVDDVTMAFRSITGNHLALVTQGRAGVECAIFDKKGGSMSEKKEGSDIPVEASEKSGREYKNGVLDAVMAIFKADKADKKTETPTKEAEKEVRPDEKKAEKKADVTETYVYVTNEELMSKLYEIEDKINKLLGIKETSDEQKEILAKTYGTDSAENKSEADKPAGTEQKEASKEVEVKNDVKEVHTWLPANTWASTEQRPKTLSDFQKIARGEKNV
jgi:hypothetical protein